MKLNTSLAMLDSLRSGKTSLFSELPFEVNIEVSFSDSMKVKSFGDFTEAMHTIDAYGSFANMQKALTQDGYRGVRYPVDGVHYDYYLFPEAESYMEEVQDG